jgi:WXXGXW repeat (2 copies)
MIKARGLKVAAAALALASVTLTGCVVAPAPGYYEGGPVMVAPPPPQVEVVGVAPAPGYVWIGGYWNWVGGRHVWVSGRWDAPPRGYHTWVAHRWVPYRGGYRLAPGHWAR